MKYQFVEYKNAALNEPTASDTSAGDAIAANTAAVTMSATNAAGRRRRKRRVEPAESNRTAPSDVPQQQLRDEEPRQHEEHVDADVTAREGIAPRVEQHDQVHRDRAQAVQMGPIRLRRCGIRHSVDGACAK